MSPRFYVLFSAVLFLHSLHAAPAPPPAPVAKFLDQHCVECHDDDVQKGGLNLQAVNFDLKNQETLRRWVRVFDRVHEGEMPPKKSEKPDTSAVKTFLTTLQGDLSRADQEETVTLGRVRSRRLTRVEYEHTIHDLLGIDIPLKDLLPEDPESHGFATVADGQQLSHHQLARYLDVADLALGEACERVLKGDSKFNKSFTPDQLAEVTRGNYRGPESRGGRSLSWPITLQFFGKMTATTVPEDGWYRITVHGVESINPGPGGAVWGTLRSGACVSNVPMLYMIGLIEATPEQRDFVYEAWMHKGHMLELKPNDATLRRAPTGAQGGNVSFKGRDLAGDGFSGIAHRGIEMQRIYPMADRAGVHRHLFGETNLKKADPATALDKLVARFARRAFRRPVTDEQLAPYLNMGRQALASGNSLTDSLLVAYRTILCSPRFLTFIEAPGELEAYALASRLSYTFWLSQPDNSLLKLAADGHLKQPEVLAQQVERMLADPKASRFIRSFTDQWLKLSKMDFTSPDSRLYPTYDAVVQESMLQETRTYVTELVQKDLSVTHLVDSDFTFLNGRLARHYQVAAEVTPGRGLQKISLTNSKDVNRGGLLTQGAILKVTADGTTTSPVIRGVFVNERLLGQHIPPPPPDIPAIEPDIRGATSIRDQLEKHRSNESCNSCHATIDPPGFVLENFDPVGIWRERYGLRGKGVPVVASGTTPKGDLFTDLKSWQQIYLHKPEQLAAGFVGQFLTYATGAPIRFGDRPAVKAIVTQTQGKNFGLRSLILEAVKSPIFTHK
ncbi:DUF1592 domain-containing protein [Prosthecobacter dejongeii]|uniref:Planctomycete cytochrome C n=1 Tax=Prosthecobacter dejongeii TaxID=48465 RepID=A0A7W8DSB8_9BACT|nr:DUF1592 domain-containing protein [Prosthecobacter dejongeii]MBB5040145.1 hypothetical protein [Prosthecobacter dejongeii]